MASLGLTLRSKMPSETDIFSVERRQVVTCRILATDLPGHFLCVGSLLNKENVSRRGQNSSSLSLHRQSPGQKVAGASFISAAFQLDAFAVPRWCAESEPPTRCSPAPPDRWVFTRTAEPPFPVHSDWLFIAISGSAGRRAGPRWPGPDGSPGTPGPAPDPAPTLG